MASNEMSECLGSSAIPINSYKKVPQVFVEDIELGFASRHAGLVQAVFADGHVQTIGESISANVWSAMGTTGPSDIVSFEDWCIATVGLVPSFAIGLVRYKSRPLLDGVRGPKALERCRSWSNSAWLRPQGRFQAVLNVEHRIRNVE
jgi:prepilin-type processing-associated H-X9-DG protein